jgi:hypothetical protein
LRTYLLPREVTGQLPHDQQRALHLRDTVGLHYSEVAAAMGRSVPAVRQLVYRARQQAAPVTPEYHRHSWKPLCACGAAQYCTLCTAGTGTFPCTE